MEFVPLVLIGLVVVIAFSIVAWQMEKKRRQELARWCRGSGYRFRPEKRSDPSLPFSIFGKGHSRYSRYHAGASLEQPVAGLSDEAGVDLFEYHYAVTNHNGKHSSTTHYHYTCALVKVPLDLGRVTIRREHLGDKLAQAMGFDDIDFEDHEFSRRFMVKAKNRRDAYELIDPRVMKFLLANSKWSIQTTHRLLFIHRTGKPKWQSYAELAQFVRRFLSELPRTLVNAERERRGLPPAVEAGNAARRMDRGE